MSNPNLKDMILKYQRNLNSEINYVFELRPKVLALGHSFICFSITFFVPNERFYLLNKIFY